MLKTQLFTGGNQTNSGCLFILIRVNLPPSTNVTLYNKFRPVVDGKLIYDFPTKLLTEGRFAHVPTIVG